MGCSIGNIIDEGAALRKTSGRGQGRVVHNQLIDFPVGQFPGHVSHFRMLSLTLLKRHELIAKIDAVLASDVRYLNVVSNSIEPMTRLAHRSDSRCSRLCAGTIGARQRCYAEDATYENTLEERGRF